MAAKHPLRRSCAFCRARKIKCSNETICEACRRQGADCIYDFEPPRPKARTVSQDNVKTETSSHNTASDLRRQRSLTSESPSGSPVSTTLGEEDATADGENVARILEQRFYENFSTDVGPRSSPWQERISDYHRSVQSSLPSLAQGVTAKYSPKNFSFSGILSLLTHDLVGLVTNKFSSLGCRHLEDGGAQFLLSGLLNDETKTMFDESSTASNPLAEYGQRQQTQLIDVWFSIHPLSFLVSKTLLLRELRDGTYDEILVAIMLADANFSIGDQVAVARGHVLLRWATAQLRTRPLSSFETSQGASGSSDASRRLHTGISTRVFRGISTAQVLMLLGWNALCSFQVRRATCYIGLAGRIAGEIKEHISRTAAPMTSSRINGIDVFDVEKEIVAYLYWTTYSLSLWAFIQMGNGHFSALLPTSLTSIFLPVTEASSVIIRLDMISENFNTLQRQKAAIREMWPLAHIVSVIAYIFALYPQSADTRDPPSTSFWQEAPLLALQRIQQGKASQDIASVCREINRVLMESIHILNKQVTETSSRSLVLLVYHTMAIHFLFPLYARGEHSNIITIDVIERLCASGHEILQIYSLISGQPQELFGATPTLQSTFPNVFCLALDTCARALSLIDSRRRMSSLVLDLPVVHAFDGKLLDLARRLYDTSHSDFLSQGGSLRAVRKLLKSNVRAFGGCRSTLSSSSSSSSIPSPNAPHFALSDPQSPHHSPLIGSHSDSDCVSSIASAAVDTQSAFSLPIGTMKMTSSLQSSVSPSELSAQSTNTLATGRGASKSDWLVPDDLLHDALDPDCVDSNTNLTHLQGSWYPQMPSILDFDTSDAMSGVQWTWQGMDGGGGDSALSTATTAYDGDSMLYYFESSPNKAAC